jgi:hypothetical protein
MALNPYLSVHTNGYTTGRDLYENMIIENIQISGLDVVYIPRTLSSRFDQIFGEDVLSSFDSHVVIEMYLSDTSGFGGESEMISKFGFEIRDTASFIVSRKRYTEMVIPIVPSDRNDKLKWRPCEGDLIYLPVSKSLFEIKFVEDEAPGFYQLSKKYVWTIRCELVQLNNEKFETGHVEVDNAFNINIDRLNTAILIENGFTMLAEDGGVILGEDYEISSPVDDVIGYGDNDAIKKEFMEIMNFSEDNPFGERF